MGEESGGQVVSNALAHNLLLMLMLVGMPLVSGAP